MKVISTAATIGQAFKNAGRVSEIVRVFARHGFWDIFHRMQMSRFLPARDEAPQRSTELPLPERLRLAFEELGPTFVKLGQLLATRSDLIPEAFVAEFQKLQDRVAGVPFTEIRLFLESEQKASLHQIFQEFDEQPLAAASIAQVHGAILKTGERVAVKVRRPGIDRIIQQDVSILRGIALLLERYIPEVNPFNPVGLVEEFFQTTLYELDFRVEANNIRKIKSNLASMKKILIPAVYTPFSTGGVLVLERFDGIRFSDREAILRSGVNPSEIVQIGCDAFFKMVMEDGLFHGDLHAGNLFVLKDGKIGIIDFGIVGRLSRRVQDSIITMFIAIMDEDYETLANEYVALCPSSDETDIHLLQRDLMDTISPYVGMALGEVNVGQILLRSTGTAVRHHLRVPRELMLLFKAIVSIDALGKNLDPTFDILQMGSQLARQVVSTRYSKERLTRDFIVLGRDLQDTLSIFPRLLKRFLRTWSQNHFAFETRSKDLVLLTSTVADFTRAFFVAAASFSLTILGLGLLFLNRGPLVLGVSFWGLLSVLAALFLLIRGLWRLRAFK